MADDKTKQEVTEEFELVEVGPDGKPLSAPGKVEDEKTTAGTAEPPESEEEPEEEEERLSLNADEQQARREERRLRNERRKAYNRQQQLKLAEIERRNQELEQRLAAVETGQGRVNVTLLQDRLNLAEQQFGQAERLLAAALTGKDPSKVTEAMRVRDAARDQYVQLNALRQRVERQGPGATAARPKAETESAEIPVPVQRHVEAFQKRHDWYDLAGSNRDSKLVQALDREVAEDGYDPASKEYWDELERRAAEVLPHRFKAGKPNGSGQNGQRRSPPVAGNGGETTDGKRRVAVTVTPERKAAMMEAGAWDDKTKRDRMLKRYAEYDRQQATARRAG